MKDPWVALILASLQASVICITARNPPDMENLNDINLGNTERQTSNETNDAETGIYLRCINIYFAKIIFGG